MRLGLGLLCWRLLIVLSHEVGPLNPSSRDFAPKTRKIGISRRRPRREDDSLLHTVQWDVWSTRLHFVVDQAVRCSNHILVSVDAVILHGPEPRAAVTARHTHSIYLSFFRWSPFHLGAHGLYPAASGEGGGGSRGHAPATFRELSLHKPKDPSNS